MFSLCLSFGQAHSKCDAAYDQKLVAVMKQLETKVKGLKPADVVKILYPTVIATADKGCVESMKRLTGHVNLKTAGLDVLLSHAFVIAAKNGNHHLFDSFKTPGKLFGSYSWKPSLSVLKVAYGIAKSSENAETAEAILNLASKSDISKIKDVEAIKEEKQNGGPDYWVRLFDKLIHDSNEIDPRSEYYITSLWNTHLYN
jgi:hypothetical protein